MRGNCRNKTIDLHGKTADEAIDYFIGESNMFLASGQRGYLIAIHGYGSSGFGSAVIKRRIREMVMRWRDYFEAVKCDDSLPGETWVIPLKPFPCRIGRSRNLAQEVCTFCETRKTDKQIFARFHRKTEQEMRSTLRELCEKGMLEAVMKKGHDAWRVPRPLAASDKDELLVY